MNLTALNVVLWASVGNAGGGNTFSLVTVHLARVWGWRRGVAPHLVGGNMTVFTRTMTTSLPLRPRRGTLSLAMDRYCAHGHHGSAFHDAAA